VQTGAAACCFLYTAEYFPLKDQSISMDERKLLEETKTTKKNVGVCFSGGGSRALSAAMGQMRGLNHLGLLDQTFFISAVSGGAWASTLYTYLPAAIPDKDFLGTVVEDPHKLWWIPLDHKAEPTNLNYLPPNNLGNVPTRLGFLSDLAQLWDLKEKYGYPMNELWVRFIGKVIFEPFGLSAVYENPSDPATYGKPTKFYSLYEWYVKNGIIKRNKKLTVNDFYLVERNRPFLVVNTSMFKDGKPGSELLPVESTAVGAGIRQSFPNAGPQGQDIGGGLVEPFAFGSTNQKKLEKREVQVDVNQRFSLSDIAGLSSAAFAETIESKHPDFNGLLPKYNYWPITNLGEAKNASVPYNFADGGNLENTGIMAQLARNVPTIICFINCETKMKQVTGPDKKPVVVVDDMIPPLFGYAPIGDGNHYKKYADGGIDPKYKPHNKNRVFHYHEFDKLLTKLWDAKQSGGPVMYLQKDLEVIPNPKFNVPGKNKVQVLWVYNSKIEKWWEKLKWELRAELDVDVLQFGNFPHYDTVLQLKLSEVQVNLLAQMSCWNIIQTEYKIPAADKTSAELFKSLYS
jgi:hypothetical protein